MIVVHGLKSAVYGLQRKNGKKLGWGVKLSLFDQRRLG